MALLLIVESAWDSVFGDSRQMQARETRCGTAVSLCLPLRTQNENENCVGLGPLVLHEHAVCCAAAGDSSLRFARLSFTPGALVRDGGQCAVILSRGQLAWEWTRLLAYIA